MAPASNVDVPSTVSLSVALIRDQRRIDTLHTLNIFCVLVTLFSDFIGQTYNQIATCNQCATLQLGIRLETRLLIEWQLLTWVRPGEAVRTRWSDIDIETGMWNIPAEFMKMKKPHKVPLSKEALRVLDLMKAISGHREWVFPSIKAPLNHMHEQTANAAIIRMGFGGELVAHGMRSIARTAAEESGKFRTDVLEAALAHSKKDEIIAAYNRAEYLTERVVLMQWWSDYVSSQKCKVIAA